MSESENRVEMSILVVDDDPEILDSVGTYLKNRGHRVHPALSGAEGVAILEREAIDIVITDIVMQEMDGFEVMQQVRRLAPAAEVILITGYNDLENVYRAMREGVFDFFTKPLKVQDIYASLQRTARFRSLRREKDRMQQRLDRIGSEARQRYGLAAIVGDSSAMQKVRNQIEQVCRSDATTVLICGETGVGKDLIARAIHYESDRAGGPFHPVNCSAIPAALFESAFYGHEKGAFTDAQEARKGHFELSEGGTLFLDEIGDLDPGMQAKLLRVLEARMVRPVGGSREVPVDVRVVTATNQDLSAAVEKGAFRQDLYYRLNVFTIRIPPLRERPEDIPPLAQHFLTRYAEELRKPVREFGPGVMDLLQSHPFPGNVRQLRNLIEQAVILCQADRISPEDMPFDTPAAGSNAPTIPNGGSETGSIPSFEPGALVQMLPEGEMNLAGFEKALVQDALRRCGGNQVHAARLLGISRMVLRKRMKRYKLTRASSWTDNSQ